MSDVKLGMCLLRTAMSRHMVHTHTHSTSGGLDWMHRPPNCSSKLQPLVEESTMERPHCNSRSSAISFEMSKKCWRMGTGSGMGGLLR